jgi:two-component system sensor kinase
VIAGWALAVGAAVAAWQGGPLAIAAVAVVGGFVTLIGRSHAQHQTKATAEVLHALSDPTAHNQRVDVDSGRTPPAITEQVRTIRAGLRAREEEIRAAIQRERLKTLELEVLADRYEETSQRLGEANEELEAFAYSASHDMAAPLRVIEGLTKIVIEDYGHLLDDMGRTHLETVHGSSERLLGLLKDLLVLSRLRPPEREDVREISVAQIVADITRDLQADIPENGHITIMGDLPTVQTPPERLRQVLQNLISNGFKYNDSEQPVVTINGWTEGGIAVIRVTDNGIGIAEAMQEEAFGLFTRLHSDRSTPGTGAGLAIARRSIRSIGGELWIEGSSDAGTSFVVALPVFFSTEAAGIRWGQILEPH